MQEDFKMSQLVVTGKVRFSYCNIFKARTFSEDQGAKYSICLLIPKTDKSTVKKIKDGMEAEIKEGITKYWRGKRPGNLKLPLRDGDVERPDSPEYKGMYFINASSTERPGIVDRNREDILDPSEVYSGCYGRASFNLYAFDKNGNRGIAAGLSNIMKLSDGPRLGGGRTSAQDDFDDDFVDEEEEEI